MALPRTWPTGPIGFGDIASASWWGRIDQSPWATSGWLRDVSASSGALGPINASDPVDGSGSSGAQSELPDIAWLSLQPCHNPIHSSRVAPNNHLEPLLTLHHARARVLAPNQGPTHPRRTHRHQRRRLSLSASVSNNPLIPQRVFPVSSITNLSSGARPRVAATRPQRVFSSSPPPLSASCHACVIVVPVDA